MRSREGVVVPLRSFAVGKARLADVLGEDARAALAREMADAVVGAAGDRPMIVVTSAPDVRTWCATRDIATIDDPGSLDAAAAAGHEWMRGAGVIRTIIAHADLPFASSFDAVAGDGEGRVAVIVPDHRDDGTPVLSIPTDAAFGFAYGPGSFARHVAEARRCELEVRIVHDDALGFDVDTPEDLTRLRTLRPSPLQ
ncbi:MAG: 2-phospho-L-lactate guanylyltransferase [Actinomycetota bacterium]